ncbi:MAG TPA: adenosine deaminase [Thermoleophilia bacterium]|nr:adenosine deaminase [Thermoleophilia bacterium]
MELHVHLEGAVRPATLLEIARRNGEALPADSVEEMEELLTFTGFEQFIQVWIVTTFVLQRAQDFRQITVEYAAQAAEHGCVYIEGIFSPSEPVVRGSSWEEVFEGYCDGVAEARERYGIEVRLTPDITRVFDPELGEETAQHAIAYRDRGVVGIGLGGPEEPPEPFACAFAVAREGGLGSVPHAGEAAGPESIRGALEALQADRIRHGIRAVEDPALLEELARRGTVLDITPISNVRLGIVPSLDEHPLPRLRAAGIPCSISTDDPELLGTDLTKDYAAAAHLGVSAREAYEAGLAGALCDEVTRQRLKAIGDAFDWESVALG